MHLLNARTPPKDGVQAIPCTLGRRLARTTIRDLVSRNRGIVSRNANVSNSNVSIVRSRGRRSNSGGSGLSTNDTCGGINLNKIDTWVGRVGSGNGDICLIDIYECTVSTVA